jgi:hypothetical protein
MVVKGAVEGQPVALTVIVNDVGGGDSQALVIMVPPPGTIAPLSAGPHGDAWAAWSTYAGHAIVEPDGRSATISADLAYAGYPVVEHVEGGWNCPAR